MIKEAQWKYALLHSSLIVYFIQLFFVFFIQQISVN